MSGQLSPPPYRLDASKIWSAASRHQKVPQLIAIDETRQGGDREQAQGHRIKLPILRLMVAGDLIFETEAHSHQQSVQNLSLIHI